ncbi:MAG: DUF418 domain-containing protein [Halobacteriales archaeon]|nr:DUF418 domain-containing protein [Halobacteriales archaeon]
MKKKTTEADKRVPSSPSPTPPSERNVSLDALRGFALLGILVINVQTFSMPFEALSNPTLYGGFEGTDYVSWLVAHVFFEGSFITLFTVMFGAGVVLFTESKEEKGQPAETLYYRRTLWLLLIGLAHAYLLWYGDILVMYALCGFFVVGLRDRGPSTQVRLGVALFALPTLLYIVLGPGASPELWNPSQEALQSQIDAYRGGWLAQMGHRVPTALSQHTNTFLLQSFWRISGLMLVGMAVFRWGVLTNERGAREYVRLFAAGVSTGIPLILAGVWYISSNGWSADAALWWAPFNYIGSVLVGFGYVGGLMLYLKRRSGGVVARALAAVGRTAFSNYLLQTVIATSIFYGHGLGLFGTVSRTEQMGFVVAIWAVQVPLSVLWLRRYRFGPVEWLWRTLTYGERQPMRVESE